jgi:cytochrome c oxidase cbb3-type subunit 2
VGIGAAEHGALAVAGSLGLAAFVLAAIVLLVSRAGRKMVAPLLVASISTVGVFGLDALVQFRDVQHPTDRVSRGREVYLAEGCQYCHSQYVRRATHDELWWGPARPFDREQRPPTPGNRRIGPDLTNVGLRRSATWNRIHLVDPRALSPGSRMPSYSGLFRDRRGEDLVAYLASLGRGGERERATEIDAASASPPPISRGSESAGREIFVRICAGCHGTSGRGSGPVAPWLARPTVNLALRALPLLETAPSAPGSPERATADQAVARAIRFGIPPYLMPGHEWLAESEVADLVAFVRSLGQADPPRP